MTERENFDFELGGGIFDPQRVTGAYFAGWLGAQPVGFYAAHLAGLGGQLARLEEARRPKPLVDPCSVHAAILLSEGYPPLPPLPGVLWTEIVWNVAISGGMCRQNRHSKQFTAKIVQNNGLRATPDRGDGCDGVTRSLPIHYFYSSSLW